MRRVATGSFRGVVCGLVRNGRGVSQTRQYSLGLPDNSEKNVKGALDFIKKNKAQMVSLRFTDLYGQVQNLQVPASEIDAGSFKNGFGFDGSSIRGWQPIHKSDMLMIPNATTAKLDDFSQHPTVNFIMSIVDPDMKPYDKDPRYVAIKSANYLKESGIADHANIGPEAEFFIFDSVEYSVEGHRGHYAVDSNEAGWNSDIAHASSYKMRPKEGYFPVSPWDTLQDIRTEMVLKMQGQGMHVEASHHEVAGAGQCEIDFKFDELVKTGDTLQLFKYIVRNVAAQHGKIATFMPKPLSNDNGTGMHTHVSLHDKDGTNLFMGDGYANLSEMALHFVGGLQKHARAVCAFSNPTINSYKRLVPGFEAPTTFAYSGRNRSAAIRIPVAHPKATRLEFRTPDPSCNPYFNFAAILMAGLDGIQNKIDPGQPLDKDIYSLSDEELAKIGTAPASLEEALDALEKDHKFLQAGNVFSDELIETWIERKREFEVNPYRKAPTPWEFQQYFDC
eukprot:TRINITY_DN21993_c0_g1_i2.p1 TRINITY_DN21993_c0_g1~~TRINITY_DN21993_c0_g1_i2.p1  ORF type:complete len:505 (+),score=86.71 TRINITY_DN21993_c0_g1_i2:112-1626(+)